MCLCDFKGQCIFAKIISEILNLLITSRIIQFSQAFKRSVCLHVKVMFIPLLMLISEEPQFCGQALLSTVICHFPEGDRLTLFRPGGQILPAATLDVNNFLNMKSNATKLGEFF